MVSLLQMLNKPLNAVPFLEIPAMGTIELNDRFVPDECQARLTDEERRPSVPMRIPVIDVVMPTIVATIATVAVA
jgi:hypothetical protein